MGGSLTEVFLVAPFPQAWNPLALGLMCVWVRANTPGLSGFLKLLEVLEVVVFS